MKLSLVSNSIPKVWVENPTAQAPPANQNRLSCSAGAAYAWASAGSEGQIASLKMAFWARQNLDLYTKGPPVRSLAVSRMHTPA